MLKKLRERKNIKLIMFLTAVLIIPAFIFWGVGSALRQRHKTSIAGKVFSKKIGKDEFLTQYKAIYSQALLLYGDNLSKLQDYLNLEGQTWRRIILLQEARRRKIKVTDEELVNWIKTFPLFQKKGKFDKNTYETVVRYYMGLRPREYEEQVRDNLKIKKLLEKVMGEIKVTEEQAWQEYKKEKDSYKISYLIFKPSSYYPEIKYTQQELIDFYQTNKQMFKKPEQVNLLYLKIDPLEFMEKIELSEDEIKEYYQEHKEEFQKKEEQENESQLKKEVEKKLKKSRAKMKAEDLSWEINEKIKEGLDLEEIAQQYHLKIVESGYFSPRDPIPGIGWAYKITQKAFDLQVGEISEVIETGDAFYFIKVKEKKAPYIPEFEEAKPQIEVSYKNKKARELALKEAKEKLSQIIRLLKEEKDLQNFLNQNNLSLKQTDFITRDKYLPGVGNASDILDNLRVKKTNEFNPEVIKVPAGYLIVRIDEIKPALKENFEKEKSSFIKRLLAKKKTKHLNQWFEQLKERANLEVYYHPTKMQIY